MGDTTQRIERVQVAASRLLYDLDMPVEARHPVRFFLVSDIRRALGEPEAHPTSCLCRFCSTQVLRVRR